MLAVAIVYVMLSGFGRLGYVEREIDLPLVFSLGTSLAFSGEQ
jgi:hypothetical protein